MNGRVIRFISAAVSVLLIAMLGQCGCGLPTGFGSTPAVLKTPVVRIGENFLKKTQFHTDHSLFTITDIAYGELDPLPGNEIGIAGYGGALFTGKDGAVKKKVGFDLINALSLVSFVDVDRDGVTEYMIHGKWGGFAGLIDHDGKLLWKYSGRAGVDDMAAGDIDGDGVLEFAVGFNGGGGIHLLDRNGQKRWQKRDGNVWHVEFYDTDGDHSDEIIHSNAGGQIAIRNADGSVRSRKHPGMGISDTYLADFSLVPWPTKSDKAYVLFAGTNKVWLMDFEGTLPKGYDAPEAGYLGDAKGTTVRFESRKAEYFAALIDYFQWQRAVLYVYNFTGELVYMEILGESCPSIAAVPLKDGGAETLLVGGQGTVWRYDLGK